jgi:hypothetical protein
MGPPQQQQCPPRQGEPSFLKGQLPAYLKAHAEASRSDPHTCRKGNGCPQNSLLQPSDGPKKEGLGWVSWEEDRVPK